MNLTEWCIKLNISYLRTIKGIHKGLSFEDAVEAARLPAVKQLTFNNETRTIKEWSKIYNISSELIVWRLKRHPEWSLENIFTTPKRNKNPAKKTDVGDKYGMLITLKFSHRDKNHYDFWLCRCTACNNKKIIMGQNLRNGMSQSCGCVTSSENGKKRAIKYEYDGNNLTLREWSEELGIKYGTLLTRRNRGWRGEKLFMIPLSLGGQPKIYLTYNGITQTISQWSKDIGVESDTIRSRIRSKMPIEKILHKGSLHEVQRKRSKTSSQEV